MPKNISVGLQNHMAQEVTTMATCWEITRRDGTIFYFTDHDQDIEFNGQTYLAAVGYSRTAISTDSSLGVDNLDIEGIFDNDEITEQDLRAGLFDFADVRIFIINYEDLTQNELKIKRGFLGEVTFTPNGTYQVEFRGFAQRLAERIGEVYTPECRADLGDVRCKIGLDDPELETVLRSTQYELGEWVANQITDRAFVCTTAGITAGTNPGYSSTLDAFNTDGTAVFQTKESWTHHGTVDEVIDNHVFGISVTESRLTDGWFAKGAIQWLTGNNVSLVHEIEEFWEFGFDASSNEIRLFISTPFDIQVNDTFLISPGCQKRLIDDCQTKFDNVLNFRGEPYVPGVDASMTYPDAKT